MSSRSRRPYLIRAIYQWATDNGYTPHLLVSADAEGVVVPREYVQDGRITLNISPMAVQNLNLELDPIWFSARFAGRGFDVQLPARAVLAVFARENGEGIVFGDVEAPDPGGPQTGSDKPVGEGRPARGRPSLKLVK